MLNSFFKAKLVLYMIDIALPTQQRKEKGKRWRYTVL